LSNYVSEDFLLLPEDIRTAGKGNLMTFLPLQETRPTWLEKWRAKKYGRTCPFEYQWSESFEWLYVWYWYNTPPNGKLGSTWIADSRYVYLGSYEALSDEERQKFLEESSDSKDTTTETPAV
jgi:hypothetical protein